MQDQSDVQLLRDYAERGAEAAFAEIVARHTDLVYSAALRQVYSSDLARDVSQSVFTDLARKARTVSANVSPEASLVGWLYRGTRFAARDLYRNETRRTQRERQAMAQLHPAPETSPDWEQLRPALDDAMSALEDTDRDAVLLRYFKNHDLRTVGTTLGISDDAAQKRVSRAVERLREFFAKRGVTVGAGGLAVVISANAVQAAPVGLALTISTTVVLTGTTLATAATVTATKAIAMTTLQKTIVAATIATLAGVGIYEARQASHLRDQVQTLKQQQEPVTNHLTGLSQALIEATNQIAALREDNERLNRNTADLLKLRGEVGRLRRHNVELERLWAGLAASTNTSAEMENPISTESVSQESWRFAGYGSPEDTVLSLAWTETQGDFEKMLAGGTSEWQEQVRRQYERGAESTGKSPEEVFADDVEAMKRIKAFRIVKSENLSDDQVLLHVRTEGLPVQMVMILKKIDNEWKIVSHHQY